MGPRKYRGMGSGGAFANAAPTAPGNGSGGEGMIGGTTGGLSFSPARNEIDDALAGRITLGMINLTILAMLAFYIYTRSSQAGG